MKSFLLNLTVLSLVLVFLGMTPASTVFLTRSGWVHFKSEAPLELIEAENNKVGAVVDVAKRSVAFKVPVLAFDGFNNALQQEHFLENYMESDNYPSGTFNGKIIEDVDLTKPGTYKVRAKGMLKIHGVEKERIIPGTIKVTTSGLNIASSFDVMLEDHDITIPRIVNQKIAEMISVEIKADLQPK